MTKSLIDGLAEADPCREEPAAPSAEETAEAQRALAAIMATPSQELPVKRRRRPGRFAAVAALGACLAALAVLLFDPLATKGPGGEILDSAVAAVSSDDAIYHIVERVTVTRTPEEEALGWPYRSKSVQIVESWHSSDGRMRAVQYRLDGASRRVEVEVARGFKETRVYDPNIDRVSDQPNQPISDASDPLPSLDPFQDPGKQLKAMRDSGRLELVGEVDADGSTAYLLRSGAHDGRMPDMQARTVEFVVDRSDYLPIRQVITGFSQLDVGDDVFEHPSQAEALRRAQRTGRTRVTEEVRREFSVYEEFPLNAETAENLELQRG
jgi:hypothetical protein